LIGYSESFELEELAMTDFYEPTNPKVGMFERRMLYLVHQMTFSEYFSARTYVEVLVEHIERVGSAPASISFSLGIPKTQSRLEALADALKNEGFANESLANLCTRSMDPSGAVWIATEKVEEAGVFVPYYHARDKTLVEGLLSDGFLDNADGWGSYKIHVLLSTAGASYSGPAHGQRMRTISKAKEAHVVRPSLLYAAPGGTITAEDDGKEHCCSAGQCIKLTNTNFYCTQVETGCTLVSDVCP
jgi:hypothetical protein